MAISSEARPGAATEHMSLVRECHDEPAAPSQRAGGRRPGGDARVIHTVGK